MHNPSTIIFDFGGVAGGTNWPLLAQALSPLFALSVAETSDLLRQYRASKHTPASRESFWSDLEHRCNVTLPEGWLATFEDLRCLATREDKAVIDIAQQLKRQGYKVALFSNVSPARAQYVRRKGLYRSFDPVVLSCEVNAKKPSPEAFEALFSQIGVPPKECLLIDDKPQTIEAARQWGMDGILFSSVENLIDELRKRGISLL
jgi:putative hydrolase of the HAD superfamily